MKPETNLLRRVYLNGDPERLPEDGEYLVCFKTGVLRDRFFLTKENRKYWLDTVDWYEIPVTREEIIKVLKSYTVNIADTFAILGEDDSFEAIADELIGGK